MQHNEHPIHSVEFSASPPHMNLIQWYGEWDANVCITAGCSECSAGRHSLHHERATGVSDLLAHLQHNGCQPVRWEVLPLRQQHHRWANAHWCGQQQDRVLGSEWERSLEKCQDQLWQRGSWVPGPAASGKAKHSVGDVCGLLVLKGKSSVVLSLCPFSKSFVCLLFLLCFSFLFVDAQNLWRTIKRTLMMFVWVYVPKWNHFTWLLSNCLYL